MLRKQATRRLAKDDDMTIDEETMAKAVEFLQSRLKPEELSHLKMMLKGEQKEEDADAKDSQVDRTPTEDSGPAPFKDMPKPGGSMAADSRGNSYSDRWPDAARIGQAY